MKSMKISHLRKPLNLAGNPFKNQAKRKVWKSQILRKPQNLAGNPFKNQAKRKVRKSQILAPNYYLKSVTFEIFFEKYISP